MAVDGYVDVLSSDHLLGWACDRDNPEKKLDVHLLVDGVFVKTIKASEFRDDLAVNGLPACGFDFGDVLAEFGNYKRLEVRCESEQVPLKNGLVDRNRSPELTYASAWLKPSTLSDINVEIHDNWPLDRLYDRAKMYHDIAFDCVASDYSVPPNAKMLEIGSGVGWPMQAGMEKYRDAHIVGLDISETMIARAKSRLRELEFSASFCDRYSFCQYDGARFPFSDDTYDIVYSYAVLWHIPDPILIRALMEAERVLKPGGLCIYQFLDFRNVKFDFESQIAIQYGGREGHHRYYRSPEQLLRIASEVVGMGNVDLESRTSMYWLRGEKKHPAKFRRSDVMKNLSTMDALISKGEGSKSES